MTIAPGTQLGAYKILDPLGSGGMGEVYRARDTRLDRDVAIKVLPPHLTESEEAKRRFTTEAKAVAALSHPNILAIHDVGEENGIGFAVMELLEGETLAERLVQGPLPVRKALELAGQMAQGLAAAHDKGIVHRDLKPANVFLTADGRIKILDFGLAKAMGVGAPETLGTQAATLHPATDPGTVMGTVGYMSPEQVRAEPLDSRSDIFSFGSVLYEMLTAERPFTGNSAVETMSAILREDPTEATSLNPDVPPPVNRILHRCLEKNKAERFQSARDLAFALENTTGGSSTGQTALVGDREAPRRSGGRWLAIALGMLIGLTAGVAGMRLFMQPQMLDPIKVTALTHTGKDWEPSASPDGNTIAFTSNRDGVERIWLRQMRGGVEVPLTEGFDSAPRFSPDGSSVLFLRDEGEKQSAYRVSVMGGQPRKILDDVVAADWAPDGKRIVIIRGGGDAETIKETLAVVDLGTAAIRVLARFEGRFTYGLRWSPDGRWIAGVAADAVLNAARDEVFVIDAETGEFHMRRKMPLRHSGATWSPDSRGLLFARSSSLLGDMSSNSGRVLLAEIDSEEERLLFWVQSVFAGGGDFVTFDYLGDNSLVFDEILWRGSLSEVTLENGVTGEERSLTHGNSRDRQPAYSPDGQVVTFSSNRSGNLDIWTLNTVTGNLRQVTDDTAEDWDPAFTVDGKGILWSSSRGGNLEIWTSNLDGSGARQVSNDGADAENPTQTADGQWVVYTSGNPEKRGVWKMRTDGSEATHLAQGAYILPEVSPDGRYVAYASTAGTANELMVKNLDSGDEVFRTQIPSLGFQAVVSAGRVRWMPDGRQLLFLTTDENGYSGLSTQDFRPGVDTRETRRPLLGFDSEYDVESFGIAPDGTRLTVARIEHLRQVKLAEGLP